MQKSKLQPLISVIVPIYNVEEYVEKCVDSIIGQTYTHLEIILVNDGSKDGSRSRIEKYKQDPRCKIIDKPNGGLSSARNTGLDHATGDYIYFIDSDDYIHPQTVELLLAKIRKTAADFCCYRIIFYSDSNSRIGGKSFQYDLLAGRDAILKDALLTRNIKCSVCLKIFSTAFLKNHCLRFPEGVINEDYLFTTLCAIYAQKVAFLNKPLYYAFERPNSISRNIKSESITSYFIISEIMRKELEKNSLFTEYRDYYYASYTKQLLYTLVQAASKLSNFTDFSSLYQNLNETPYKQSAIGKNIRLFGRPYSLLYRLSMRPRFFYAAIKSLKTLGFHMP